MNAAAFETIFEKQPEVVGFAPGRVNLIGEHTDYNGGHVFPCALQMGITCAAARRTDGTLRFVSENFCSTGIVEYALADLSPQGVWADYPVGVIRAFAAYGYPLEHGADFYFSGDLPDGAGLSSSAALEVVTGTVLRDLFSLPVTKQEIALIGQFAENRFIGVNCGIMDQFASAMGKSGCAILLHAGTLAYEYAPLGSAALVIVNSGVKHSLAASAYNDRRRECEAACSALRVSTLCALTPEEFERNRHLISDPVCRKRAKHVIYENRRALDGAAALRRGDLAAFGALMNASHASLRDDYEVSCAELDFLAETAQKIDGVYGARMTGGGFGGCTVNLMEPAAVERFVTTMQAAYAERFGFVPEIYPITAADGARSERV
ncbi:MAG: galactokinase [Oscillospiraceae bacterium]|nr:galactokinase [Oscillospiraceae bacterium]